ncbi:MAG: c-type cytochrome [Planctomycetota bacterium]|jgi:mono/diheme cytochrome c family protein
MGRIWVLLLLSVTGTLVLPGRGGPAQAGKGDKDRGAQLYAKHCAICHGPQGRGDGPAAYLLSPKPRDFTRGEFRVITTTNGVPTDNDLLRVLENGMPGSAMPPWDRLAESDRRLLTRKVRELWRTGLIAEYKADGATAEEIQEYLQEDTTPGEKVSFAGQGEPTLARIARGRIVYTQACAPCHGQEGRGETTQTLVDSRGHPAPARDFTKGIFKGGPEAPQIYARLRSGMKGTAMPTYAAGAMADEDAWSVVHYIRTLFPPAVQARQTQKTRLLKIGRVKRLPANADEWWQAAPPTYLALMPLWWRDKRVEGLVFQGVHDGETFALRIVWEDTTEDRTNLKSREFHDGAAVQLSAAEDPPFFGMGDDAASVLIWSWKASWQEDQRGYRDVESAYPYMNLDTYFPVQKNLKAGERPERDAVGAPHHDPTYLSGWGAGNPVSNPDRPSAVEVARAKGQGTITTQEREVQQVQGRGVWDRGVWTLEIRAKLAPNRAHKFLAFAVWNGSQMDRNGQKSVSIWHRVEVGQ